MSDAPSQPPKVPPGVYTTKPPITPSPLALAERLEQQARILLDALEHGTFFPELGEAAAMAFRASVVSAAAQAVIAVDAVRSSAGAGERMAGFAHAAYKAVAAATGPAAQLEPKPGDVFMTCPICKGTGEEDGRGVMPARSTCLDCKGHKVVKVTSPRPRSGGGS